MDHAAAIHYLESFGFPRSAAATADTKNGMVVFVPQYGTILLQRELDQSRYPRAATYFECDLLTKKKDLKKYYAEHGLYQVPRKSGGQLGEWVHKQRRHFKKRNANFMATTFAKMEEIGFEWSARYGFTFTQWDDGMEALVS